MNEMEIEDEIQKIYEGNPSLQTESKRKSKK
jgi:hypothetical protein